MVALIACQANAQQIYRFNSPLRQYTSRESHEIDSECDRTGNVMCTDANKLKCENIGADFCQCLYDTATGKTYGFVCKSGTPGRNDVDDATLPPKPVIEEIIW